MTISPAPITIRPGYADDARAVSRLTMLDSADHAPPEPLLLAEVDGLLRAVLSLKDGSAIADPFFASAHLVELLQAHAGVLNSARARPRRRHPFSIGTLTRLPHSVQDPS